MTNSEYEAASVAAAGCYDRFEGEHKLKQWDEHIATLEAALAKAQEARREIVNKYNLNKCKHEYTWDSASKCVKCGSDRPRVNVEPSDDSWDTDRRPGGDGVGVGE